MKKLVIIGMLLAIMACKTKILGGDDGPDYANWTDSAIVMEIIERKYGKVKSSPTDKDTLILITTSENIMLRTWPLDTNSQYLLYVYFDTDFDANFNDISYAVWYKAVWYDPLVEYLDSLQTLVIGDSILIPSQ